MIVDISQLLSAFAKRRCAICGAQAQVFSQVDDDDLNLCLSHANSIGWPWESELIEPALGSVAL